MGAEKYGSGDSHEEEEEEEEEEDEEEGDEDRGDVAASEMLDRVGQSSATHRRILLLTLMLVPGVVAAHTVYCLLELHADRDAVRSVRGALEDTRDAAHAGALVSLTQLAHADYLLNGVESSNHSRDGGWLVDSQLLLTEVLSRLSSGRSASTSQPYHPNNQSSVYIELNATNMAGAHAQLLRYRLDAWLTVKDAERALRTKMDHFENTVRNLQNEADGRLHAVQWADIRTDVTWLDPSALFPSVDTNTGQLDIAQMLALARAYIPAVEADFYMYIRTGRTPHRQRFAEHTDALTDLFTRLMDATRTGNATALGVPQARLSEVYQNVSRVHLKLLQEWSRKQAKNDMDDRATVGNSTWSLGPRDLPELITALRGSVSSTTSLSPTLETAAADLLSSVKVPDRRPPSSGDWLLVVFLAGSLYLLGLLAVIYCGIASRTARVARSVRAHRHMMYQLHRGDDGDEHGRLMQDKYQDAPGWRDYISRHHAILFAFAAGLAIVLSVNVWALDNAEGRLDGCEDESRVVTQMMLQIRKLQEQISRANLLKSRFVITGDSSLRYLEFDPLIERHITDSLHALNHTAPLLPEELRSDALLRLNRTNAGVAAWRREITTEYKELDEGADFLTDADLLPSIARFEDRASSFLSNAFTRRRGWEFPAEDLVNAFNWYLDRNLYSPHNVRTRVCQFVSPEGREGKGLQTSLVDERAVASPVPQCGNVTREFATCGEIVAEGGNSIRRHCNWSRGCQYQDEDKAAGKKEGCINAFGDLTLTLLSTARDVASLTSAAAVFLVTGDPVRQAEYLRLLERLTGAVGSDDFGTLMALNMVHELEQITSGREWTLQNKGLVDRVRAVAKSTAEYINQTLRVDYEVLRRDKLTLDADGDAEASVVAKLIRHDPSSVQQYRLNAELDALAQFTQSGLNDIEGDCDSRVQRRKGELVWVTIAFAWAGAAALALGMYQHQLIP
eukprot:Hpha_TRINITY_DN16152_c3_g5::TRINITY_DN16152_c3_g5_i1::g.6088::m.6088